MTIWNALKGLKIILQQPELYKEANVAKSIYEEFSGLEKKLETLYLKKHRVQVFLAECDGTAPPELPSELKGKSLNSPITPFYERNVDSVPKLSMSNEVVNHTSSASSPTKSSSPVVSEGSSSHWAAEEKNVAPALPSRKPTNTSRVTIKCSAKVIYDFEAAPNSQEMSVKTGDILDVIEQQEDG